MKTKVKEPFLDKKLLDDFNSLIRSSNIFYESSLHKNKWNLICTVMDRLYSATDFFNSHGQPSDSEDNFILFFVYACIVKDGVYTFYENIYGRKPDTLNNKNFFEDTFIGNEKFFGEGRPTDDVIFEYLRSIVFAHPFETSKSKRSKRTFMEEGEIHISPWINPQYRWPASGTDSFCIRVYTNKESPSGDIKDIRFSYESLKGYIKERYNLLKIFIDWGKDAIDSQEAEWKQTKIDRSVDNLQIIVNAKKILNDRYIEFYDYELQLILDYLKYNSGDEKNKKVVNEIITTIQSSINEICDSVDNIDYEKLSNILEFLDWMPSNMHQYAHYQLEKTYSYLDVDSKKIIPGSNYEWGLKQAKLFYEEYAKKYVNIDFEQMSNQEIMLLIRASCIIGKIEQNNEQ